jgi:hypothetical protein
MGRAERRRMRRMERQLFREGVREPAMTITGVDYERGAITTETHDPDGWIGRMRITMLPHGRDPSTLEAYLEDIRSGWRSRSGNRDADVTECREEG